ncbi:MAG: hypothetical protein V7719_09575 [Psychroserpens sp.]|uniref:hypothetical protein n=1 Tax=Psychroserpens sp. TaxID=2020870 RepID=UPI0030036319
MEKKYKYIGYFMIFLIPLTFFGFYKTYFGLIPVFNEKTDTITHLHAFVSTLWIGALIVQPFLISNKKFKTHRAIGKFTYVLFPLLVVFFILQMTKKSGEDNVLQAIFFPLRDLSLLTIFYGLAIYHKKQTAIHMRYMIASAMVFLFPTVGRITGIIMGIEGIGGTEITYLLIYSIFLGLIYYDTLSKTKVRTYHISCLCFMVSQLFFFFIFL